MPTNVASRTREKNYFLAKKFCFLRQHYQNADNPTTSRTKYVCATINAGMFRIRRRVTFVARNRPFAAWPWNYFRPPLYVFTYLYDTLEKYSWSKFVRSMKCISDTARVNNVLELTTIFSSLWISFPRDIAIWRKFFFANQKTQRMLEKLTVTIWKIKYTSCEQNFAPTSSYRNAQLFPSVSIL